MIREIIFPGFLIPGKLSKSVVQIFNIRIGVFEYECRLFAGYGYDSAVFGEIILVFDVEKVA